MKQFVYNGSDCDLKTVLRREVAGATPSVVRAVFKNRDVKVNGVRAGADFIVRAGDVITVYIKQSLMPAVVYQDDNIIVFNKRAGMETCDSGNSLHTLAEEFFGRLYPVHRLDAQTVGLVIFAKNPQSEAQLKQAFKNRTIKKFYLAEVAGSPQQEATLEAYLVKDAKRGRVEISQSGSDGAKKIVTKYRILESRQASTLLEVELVTGATHQIRAHLAFVGLPILGDDLYGAKEQNRKSKKRRPALTAYKVVFSFDAKPLCYLDKKEITIAEMD